MSALRMPYMLCIPRQLSANGVTFCKRWSNIVDRGVGWGDEHLLYLCPLCDIQCILLKHARSLP